MTKNATRKNTNKLKEAIRGQRISPHVFDMAQECVELLDYNDVNCIEINVAPDGSVRFETRGSVSGLRLECSERWGTFRIFKTAVFEDVDVTVCETSYLTIHPAVFDFVAALRRNG